MFSHVSIPPVETSLSDSWAALEATPECSPEFSLLHRSNHLEFFDGDIL